MIFISQKIQSHCNFQLFYSWRIKSSVFPYYTNKSSPKITKKFQKKPNKEEVTENNCVKELINEIMIKRINKIYDERYNTKIIYESYKPSNLYLMLDYINFCISFRNILPNRLLFYDPYLDTDMRSIFGNSVSLIEQIALPNFIESPNVSTEIKTYYDTEFQSNLPSQLDQTKILIFDSKFECGNLDRVNIISLNEYNLFLNTDTNTYGHTQWFYFSVSNTFMNQEITFHILNCCKSGRLFNEGMNPLVYSEKEYENNETEWMSNTYNVSYIKNDLNKNLSLNSDSNLKISSNYYTLTFSYKFKYNSDKVYFAYSRPYTLGMHFSLLNTIKRKLLRKATKAEFLDDDKLNERIKEFLKSSDENEQIGIHKRKKVNVKENNDLIHQ